MAVTADERTGDSSTPEPATVPAPKAVAATTGGGVVTGVARTALMVAAARAIESGRPDALAHDPYAGHFVRASGGCDDWPLHPDDVPDGLEDPLWGHLGRYFGLRTRVFDDHLTRQAEAGIRQVVLLGAGLDTRAHRLPWPRDCTVYELDREPVLAFKQRILDAPVRPDTPPPTPRARRVPIAADLRLDWIDALCGAGFDPERPTAWVVEGLLLYLPAAVESRMIDTIDRFSVPGSSLAYEVKLGIEPATARASPLYSTALKRIGIDLVALFDRDPRPDSAALLTERGWRTETHDPYDHTRRLGRGPLPEPSDALAGNRWTFAALTEDGRSAAQTRPTGD
ncbi:SAM-dependent methyltransferase [Streptomyces sp. NPDC094437]|uniref:SAM-dependent methyltransferase n=1 Tax=Streptomyces sp. NPDC094437 TaxID=3366060 RepID=UPI0037FAC908